MSIKFSIIIPNYNGASFVSETFFSVFAQTYQNFEIICVDDASTDNSVKILKNLAQQTDRPVKIIKNAKNMGQARTRNVALKEAQGDYVIFLDGDDLLYDENVLQNIVDHPYLDASDMLLLNVHRFNHDKPNEVSKVHATYKPIVYSTSIHQNPELALMFAFWSYVYKREFLTKNNLKNGEQYRSGEDFPFFMKALSKNPRLTTTNIKGFLYRTNRGNSTTSANSEEFFKYRLQGVVDALNLAKILDESLPAPCFKGFTLIRYFINFINYIGKYHHKSPQADIEKYFQAFRKTLHEMGMTKEEALAGYEYITGEDASKRPRVLLFLALLLTSEASCHEIMLLFKYLRPEQITDAFAYLEEETCEDIYRFFYELTIPREEARQELIQSLTEATRKFERIIIHAGFTKCASTSLQLTAKNNLEKLSEEGILYPIFMHGHYDTNNKSSGCNRFFIMAQNFFENHANIHAQKYLEDMVSLLTKHSESTLIISSENLSYYTPSPEFLNFIKEIFHNPEIMFITRDVEKWLPSIYLESLSNGAQQYTKDYESFVNESYANGTADHEGIIQSYRDIFGEDKVVCFELSDFEQALSFISPKFLDIYQNSKKDYNVTSNYKEYAELFRSINALPFDGIQKRHMSNIIHRYLENEDYFEPYKELTYAGETILDHFELQKIAREKETIHIPVGMLNILMKAISAAIMRSEQTAVNFKNMQMRELHKIVTEKNGECEKLETIIADKNEQIKRLRISKSGSMKKKIKGLKKIKREILRIFGVKMKT